MFQDRIAKPRTARVKNDPNTAVIGLSDLLRIQNTIVPDDYQKRQDENRKAYDEKLKEISKVRMRKWPDSIEMSKKNKLDERKQLFYKKEEERRKIDEEERKFQELEKKMVVDRANKMYFEGQDAVKSFNSKLMVADAMKEREYQVEIKRKKEEVEKDWENMHLQQMYQNMIEFDKKEEEKVLEEQAKKHHRMGIVNQQLKDAKIKRIKEYQDRVIEGEVIKKRAREEVEEQKQKEIEKLKKIERMNKEFVEDNIKLEKIREQNRVKEALELKKIEEFAIKKEEMDNLRKRKEEEKFQEKQRQRQQIIDKQIEYLKNLKSNQDAILAKHIKEAEEKRNNELAERDRKFREFKVRIN